jgi:transposase
MSECPSLMELDRLRCEVEAVREALEAVEAERRAAAVAAVRGGMNKRSVALAAGVTRQTLDKWLGVWRRTS